jgi:hypothetical protein
VEAPDADVDDARDERRPVVGRHRDVERRHRVEARLTQLDGHR